MSDGSSQLMLVKFNDNFPLLLVASTMPRLSALPFLSRLEAFSLEQSQKTRYKIRPYKGVNIKTSSLAKEQYEC